METITPFIGLATFPVALGGAFIAYGATGDTRAIGFSLVIAAIASVAIWLVVRTRASWRSGTRMSNELLLALLVATIGMMFLVGGLAALSPIWIGVGAAVLVGAWLVQRSSSSTAT